MSSEPRSGRDRNPRSAVVGIETQEWSGSKPKDITFDTGAVVWITGRSGIETPTPHKPIVQGSNPVDLTFYDDDLLLTGHRMVYLWSHRRSAGTCCLGGFDPR